MVGDYLTRINAAGRQNPGSWHVILIEIMYLCYLILRAMQRAYGAYRTNTEYIAGDQGGKKLENS